MNKQPLGKARIYRFENGRFLIIWKGQETTLRKFRDEVDKLIQQEQDYQQSMLMRVRGAS